MKALLLLTLVAVLCSACSLGCEQTDFVGTYELSAGQHVYQLHLGDDGGGSLARNQVEFGSLQWEVEPSNGQIFVKGDRQMLEVLREVSGTPPFPRDVADWKSGYRGITPRCGLNGTVKRLELDTEGRSYFLKN